jgi:hypothetical protein
MSAGVHPRCPPRASFFHGGQRSALGCARQCHGTSNRPVERSADHSSFFLGYGTEVSTAGPRWQLRKLISKARCRHGPRRGAHSAAQPLAECLCRTRNWQHTARLPESIHRTERPLYEIDPDELFSLIIAGVPICRWEWVVLSRGRCSA